jgi:hypothetical protein
MSKMKMKMRTKPKMRDMDLDAFIKSEEAKLGIKGAAGSDAAVPKTGLKKKNLKPSFKTKMKTKTPLQESEPINIPASNVVRVNQNKIPVIK